MLSLHTMDREHILSLTLLLLTIIEPGCGFLFKRSQDLDSGDSIVHLKRRYWNDGIQPCIEKYCWPIQNKMTYIKCLQHRCPSAVLAVPRDLDAMSLFPIDMILGNTEFCADDFINSSPPLVGNFDADNMLSLPGDGSTTILKYDLYTLCRASLCQDVRGSAHFACVRQRCCGRNDEPSTHYLDMRKRTAGTADIAVPMTRKRRVNNEVTQCIQSYCSGSEGAIRDRLACIVKNCNRA